MVSAPSFLRSLAVVNEGHSQNCLLVTFSQMKSANKQTIEIGEVLVMGKCLVFHHIYKYKGGTICMVMIASVYLIYPCWQVFRMGYLRKYQLEREIVLQTSLH